MTARMGIYQETVYSKHGKHPMEALFYNVSDEYFITHFFFKYVGNNVSHSSGKKLIREIKGKEKRS